MSQTTRRGPRGLRHSARAWFSLAAAVVVAACQTGENSGSTDPLLPADPPPNPQLAAASFVMDVDVLDRAVRITAPTADAASAVNPSIVGGPSFSILAGDVVELTTSNFAASEVGAFIPGRVRVTFDVSITNRLGGVQLITPTFPVPPAGTDGVILFPFATNVTTTSGGTSTGGDGTEIIIELPNRGEVEPSPDWDGEEFNFFNDQGCAAEDNDCYRYETFAQPVFPGATSEASAVGFDIDPTVGNFRARLIVAADLANSGAAPTGTIAGNVSSPQRGPLVGVEVDVAPGGFTGTTDAAGDYSIADVNTGPRTVALSNLPAGCTDPGGQNVTVADGVTSTVDFTVTCDVPTGTIAGTITSDFDGAALSGVTVSATPTGGSATPSISTDASGVYTLTGVPVNVAADGALTLGLPSFCPDDPGTRTYSGLAEGGTITVDIVADCDAPPPDPLPINATWSTPTGGQVQLTITAEMGTEDDVFAVSGQVLVDEALLTFASSSNGTNPPNFLQNCSTAPTAEPGERNWQNFNSLPGGPPPATGSQILCVVTYDVVGSGSATPTLTLSAFADLAGTDLQPRAVINVETLTLP